MDKITLFKTDSKGKTREWNISVIDNGTTADKVVYAGIQGGKMVETITTITEGKNIGKTNETTPYQQAVSEAESDINTKRKKGYVEDLTNLKAHGETHTIKQPMKGHHYHPEGKNKAMTLEKAKIKGKRIGIQRKLDGWRYRIHVTKDSVNFYTSGGDLTLEFPQITKSIRESFDKIYDYVNKKYGIEEYYLDGEIYNHHIKQINLNNNDEIIIDGKKITAEEIYNKFNRS